MREQTAIRSSVSRRFKVSCLVGLTCVHWNAGRRSSTQLFLSRCHGSKNACRRNAERPEPGTKYRELVRHEIQEIRHGLEAFKAAVEGGEVPGLRLAV
jgi:hypothetical protein